MLDLMREPDRAKFCFADGEVAAAKAGAAFSARGVRLTAAHEGGEVVVRLDEAAQPLCRAMLRWDQDIPSLRVLGDHWERGYGDLEWRGMVPERVLPWFFLVCGGGRTAGAGVAVQANALCYFQVDPRGVTLALDVRCGGTGLVRAEPLELCRVRQIEPREGESAFAAGRRLAARLCAVRRLPAAPVYGGNNWYYAYGQSSTPEILADAARIADWSGENANRPFMVIDDGWQIEHGGGYNGGPWDRSNADYPDMAALAEGMKRMGVRPGIWLRPLLTRENVPESWKLQRPIPEAELHGGCVLDPSVPEALEHIRGMFTQLEAWGYELIKQDFSTFDLLGRWGFQMGARVTDEGWAFADRSKTTAMVIRGLYAAMRAGVRDQTLLMGCNTLPHLSAGVFELSRTGDDTSGRDWEKTRLMGVNTLAFRMLQHDIFQSCDADCVGLTRDIDWAMNAQWLDLLSRSGTPLFVSAAPDAVEAPQQKALREAFRRAAAPHAPAEPLDWMDNTCPALWRTDEGEFRYNWYEAFGAEPLKR